MKVHQTVVAFYVLVVLTGGFTLLQTALELVGRTL